MTTPGGESIQEIARRHGRDGLVREAEAAGLSPRQSRMRCPACVDDVPLKDRKRNATIFDIGRHATGGAKWKCFRCGEGGDLFDLLKHTRGLELQEALAYVQGLTAPPPRPIHLRSVPPPDDDKYLTSAQVKDIWEKLATTDEASERYLESRGLEDAVGDGLVRFATETGPKQVQALARRGYRVAVLMSDVTGQPRGIQLRLVREARSKEPKILSVKGSATSKAFFGDAQAIETEPFIIVAEGMADTLALALWGRPHVVVGAGGKDSLHRLADELRAAGLDDLQGRTFVMAPQNDRPRNHSRREFMRLAQLLGLAGAAVAWLRVPDEYKDIAEWRSARPETPWPPPELERYLSPPEEEAAEPGPIITEGAALPIPAQVRVLQYGGGLKTLAAILDDAATRQAIMGRGELAWNEMTFRVQFNGRDLTSVDTTTIRLGLEESTRATDGKPLKFTAREIEDVLELLAHRKRVHPVRDWLRGLRWDGVSRLEAELPAALGYAGNTLEATMLRRWMVSAVARPMRPGTKVDTVLILVGKQGQRKSTFFEGLAGDWFTDSAVHPGDKDGLMILREKWIVEWGELESLKRSRSIELVKSFLSRRVDDFRAPYGDRIISAPRHAVIVGTSNPKDILGDATGNRRFWPIEVRVPRINLAWLKSVREQLWAEAVHLYDGATGCPVCAQVQPLERCEAHRWWLTDEEDVALEEAQRDFEDIDVWEHAVADWLADQPFTSEVTTDQVQVQALDLKLEELNSNTNRRVVAILRKLGWDGPHRCWQGNVARRVYRRGAR